MELRYLRYFVAVAETRHFTKAAEMLGISQPPLSQQIKKLEEEIGTPLLKRLKSGVVLTVAGEAFYQDACRILEMTGNALERAKGLARGIRGKLSIGFASSTAFHPRIFQLLRRFQTQFPAMVLLPREDNMAALMHDLHEGLLDAAFVRLPCESSKDFNIELLAREKMALALPQDHRLSKSQSLSLNQLRDEQLVLFPRHVAPSLYEVIFSACLRAGFDADRVQQSPQISSAIGMVAAGFGVALIPESLCNIRLPGVSFHRVEDDALGSDIALAWRRWDRSPALHQLVMTLSDCKSD